ncbi:hypothetical protein CsSME_00014084 [Camellia sinensis var. sinensis]
MNRLRYFFEYEESITEFKTLNNILDDVVVRFSTSDDSITKGSEERIPLLLINIVEGGVRFPVHPLFRDPDW